MEVRLKFRDIFGLHYLHPEGTGGVRHRMNAMALRCSGFSSMASLGKMPPYVSFPPIERLLRDHAPSSAHVVNGRSESPEVL